MLVCATIKILSNCCSTEDYNYFTIWKIIRNCMKSIGHYFCPTVLWCLSVHMACWHCTWPLGERFEIGVALTILIKNSYVSRQTKQIKSAILKHSWNVERLKEHNRQNVVWGLSCEWWLERNVKWIWNVSRERWREAASRFEKITSILRPNIDVSI